MQEDLIEKVIDIEKHAKSLKEDISKEFKEIEEKYEKRMAREEKLKLENIKKKGEKILAEHKEGAEKFAQNLEGESKKEIKKIEADYQEVKDGLLKKYFDKIVSSGR